MSKGPCIIKDWEGWKAKNLGPVPFLYPQCHREMVAEDLGMRDYIRRARLFRLMADNIHLAPHPKCQG